MNLIKSFKNLDKTNKFIIIFAVIVMILLIGNLIMSIRHISQFNSIRNSGNDRWFQVEDRIKVYENKVDELEKIIEQIK